MSSNSTASTGAAGGTRCCKATTLVAVAATSFVCCFILVVAFLFVRFLLHRQRWRQRARRLLQEQHQRSKPGLDAAAIAMLPSFPYRRRADANADAEGGSTTSVPAAAAECAVCLGILDEGQTVRQLPGCSHVFHQECIDVWLASRASCPVCRGKAEPPEPARAEGDRDNAASTTARVAAVEMFDDEELASSSTPREAEREGWTTRPETGSGLAWAATASRQLLYNNGRPMAVISW